MTFLARRDIFMMGVCALIKILPASHYINITILPHSAQSPPLKKEFFEEKLRDFQLKKSPKVSCGAGR
ncbi:hypothetical protein QHH03_17400, partial [Aphanizomenon sp. 202]|nr:hypothetical protein [Aphanizomenon sp. 202]